MKSGREVKHGRVPPPNTNIHAPQHRPWATCMRSVKHPTRHPPFCPVAFIPILHDPCLLGSCVPPGSYGEASFDEAEGSDLTTRDSLSQSSIHCLFAVDVTPWTLLVSTALEFVSTLEHSRYHLPQVVMVLRSGDGSITALCFYRHSSSAGSPVAQMPPQLSPPGIRTSDDNNYLEASAPEPLSEGSLLRVPKHPVSQDGR